jgi:hypothetical protein
MITLVVPLRAPSYLIMDGTSAIIFKGDPDYVSDQINSLITPTAGDKLLQESGDALLLESSDFILLE